jgi:dipeptidyl aminopeptidase/acylaminoacyl peptidase
VKPSSVVAFPSRGDLRDERRRLVPDAADDSPGTDWEPAWSPDGTRIAFFTDRDGGNSEVYVMNADGSAQTNLTQNAAFDAQPDWQATRLPKSVTLKAKPKRVEKGERVRLKAKVAPCAGHEGDPSSCTGRRS